MSKKQKVVYQGRIYTENTKLNDENVLQYQFRTILGTATINGIVLPQNREFVEILQTDEVTSGNYIIQLAPNSELQVIAKLKA